ncbi:MAG: hypothetical protein QW199_01290 [Candidatus Pacearchaeota archaeon]
MSSKEEREKEERARTRQLIKEAEKFLEEKVGPLVGGKFHGIVNEKVLKEYKKNADSRDYRETTQLAARYFNEIDQYITPEVLKLEPNFYDRLIKTKKILGKIAVC